MGGDDDAFVRVLVAVDAIEVGREVMLAEALAVGGDDDPCDVACGAEWEGVEGWLCWCWVFGVMGVSA